MTSTDDPSEPRTSLRSGLSRRTFMMRTTATAAAVGMAGSLPGLAGLLSAGTADAPEVDSGAADIAGEVASMDSPLVAHIKDLQTGEISLYRGEQEIVVRNPALAHQLFSASRP